MKMVRDEGAIGWIRKFTVGAMAQPAKIGFGSCGQSLLLTFSKKDRPLAVYQ
jgi:hypothetical protein